MVEKRPTGIWTHVGMATYCSGFGPGEEPPWCGGGGGTEVAGQGEQDYGGVQDCQGTDNVTADCRCSGSTPQKVYAPDGTSEGEFYCRSKPPTEPCPSWDHTFNFDVSVWSCVERPLDEDAEVAANRVKDCFRSDSTTRTNWDHVLRFEYGPCPTPGALGCVPECSPEGSVVRFDMADLKERGNNEAEYPGTTVWQWFAETMNHEHRHVYHNATYECQPWNNSQFWIKEKVPSWVPRNADGEEIVAAYESTKEFKEAVGVFSPRDRRYVPSRDGQLPNCRL